MRRLVKVLLLVGVIAALQGCGPVEKMDSQGSEIAKNIIISPDSTSDLDPATIKEIVTKTIDCDQWASVTVLAESRGDGYMLYGQLASADVYELKFFQMGLDAENEVSNLSYDVFWPNKAAGRSFYPSCPNSSMETYWTTECSTISSSVSAINKNDSTAKNRGYVSTKAIGSGESYTNVTNYLSCSGLKVWGRVGHGYTGGLQLTGGQMLSSFSMSLDGHGVYANSCLAYNDPFKSRVFNAGAEWFVSGITNLYIGPSEAVFSCAMGKALSQTNVCSAVNSCMQSGAGTHGCGGPNQVIPKPGGGPNPTPTPTPGPTPTPTPGDSCQGMCGKKSGSCWCDNLCKQYGDCCPDYDQFCGPNPTPTPQPTPTPTPGKSCQGYCGQKSPDGCWCDNLCKQYNDCCPDYDQVC